MDDEIVEAALGFADAAVLGSEIDCKCDVTVRVSDADHREAKRQLPELGCAATVEYVGVEASLGEEEQHQDRLRTLRAQDLTLLKPAVMLEVASLIVRAYLLL